METINAYQLGKNAVKFDMETIKVNQHLRFFCVPRDFTGLVHQLGGSTQKCPFSGVKNEKSLYLSILEVLWVKLHRFHHTHFTFFTGLRQNPAHQLHSKHTKPYNSRFGQPCCIQIYTVDTFPTRKPLKSRLQLQYPNNECCASYKFDTKYSPCK